MSFWLFLAFHLPKAVSVDMGLFSYQSIFVIWTRPNLIEYTSAHCENHTPAGYLSYTTNSLKCDQPACLL